MENSVGYYFNRKTGGGVMHFATIMPNKPFFEVGCASYVMSIICAFQYVNSPGQRIGIYVHLENRE